MCVGSPTAGTSSSSRSPPDNEFETGGDNDPHAVVDWQRRVRGVDNLRVGDASILPDVPSIAPLPTIIMAAERISDWITVECTSPTFDRGKQAAVPVGERGA